MIYFDNSATTKPYPEALATYTEVATRIWGNPSSLHNLGSQATRIFRGFSKQIAELIGKKAGGNLLHVWWDRRGQLDPSRGVAFEKAPYGKHIIVSDIEHPAIKESAAWLKTQGFEVDYAPVDALGFVKVDAPWLVFSVRIRPWSLSWPSTMRLAPSSPSMKSRLFWKIAQRLVSMSMRFKPWQR